MEIFLSFFSQIISAKARLNFSPFFLRCFFHPSPSFQPLKKIVCFLPFVLNWIKKKRKKNISPSRPVSWVRKWRKEKVAEWETSLGFSWEWGWVNVSGGHWIFSLSFFKRKTTRKKSAFCWRVVCLVANGVADGSRMRKSWGYSSNGHEKKEEKPGDQTRQRVDF